VTPGTNRRFFVRRFIGGGGEISSFLMALMNLMGSLSLAWLLGFFCVPCLASHLAPAVAGERGGLRSPPKAISAFIVFLGGEAFSGPEPLGRRDLNPPRRRLGLKLGRLSVRAASTRPNKGRLGRKLRRRRWDSVTQKSVPASLVRQDAGNGIGIEEVAYTQGVSWR